MYYVHLIIAISKVTGICVNKGVFLIITQWKLRYYKVHAKDAFKVKNKTLNYHLVKFLEMVKMFIIFVTHRKSSGSVMSQNSFIILF